MILPLLVFYVIVIVALLVMAWRRPEVLQCEYYSHTRMALFGGLFCFGASVLFLQGLEVEASDRTNSLKNAPEEMVTWAFIAQALTWVFLVFSVRGVLTMLVPVSAPELSAEPASSPPGRG